MLARLFVVAVLAQDPTEEVNALWKEYGAARDAFERSLKGVKDPDERHRLEEQNPAVKYLARFRELSARLTESTAAQFCVFKLALELYDSKAGHESAWTILKSDPSGSIVGGVARELQYAHALGWKWAREWLRAAIEKTQARDVKAAAMFSFGYTVSAASKATTEEREEARRFLRLLEKDFADTQQGKLAGRLLFELEKLAIGCVAPDFEAKDVDGMAFKLSDYRGKVVVLTFWGFW